MKRKDNTEMNDLLEKLVDKVKTKGQAYMPPAVDEHWYAYAKSLYYSIKSGKSVAFIMVINRCRIILEEQPYPNDPQKISARCITMSKDNDFSPVELEAQKGYSTIKVPWLVKHAFQKDGILGASKTLEDFLTSLC